MSIHYASPPAATAGKLHETELLLCCARTVVDDRTGEKIRSLLKERIDWTYVTETATQHGVMPLLYWTLHTACPQAAPQAQLDQLQRRFHANALRNVLLTKELLRILNLLKTHGIPAIPFKGPALAVAAYGELALRQFSDLDILVHARDVAEVKDVLVSEGYSLGETRTRSQEAACLKLQHHHQLTNDDVGVAVELHWRLAENRWSFPLDHEHVWARLEHTSLTGVDVATLGSVDLLLVLCMHGAKHGWQRLGWLCDVAELIRVRRGLDWGPVTERAGVLRVERRLSLGILLAKDVLGADLPETLQSSLRRDAVIDSLASRARSRLFRETSDPATAFAWIPFHLRSMDGNKHRLRSGIHFALTRTVLKWALRPPVGLLRRPFELLDRTPTWNTWMWPLPLFALLSFVYHLLLPVRRLAKRVLNRAKRP